MDQIETEEEARPAVQQPADSKSRRGHRLGLIGVGAGLLVVTLAWVAFLGWALVQLRHLV